MAMCVFQFIAKLTYVNLILSTYWGNITQASCFKRSSFFGEELMNTYRITFALVVVTESSVTQNKEIIYRGKKEFLSPSDEHAEEVYHRFRDEKEKIEIDLPSDIPTLKKKVRFDCFHFYRVHQTEEVQPIG